MVQCMCECRAQCQNESANTFQAIFSAYMRIRCESLIILDYTSHHFISNEIAHAVLPMHTCTSIIWCSQGNFLWFFLFNFTWIDWLDRIFYNLGLAFYMLCACAYIHRVYTIHVLVYIVRANLLLVNYSCSFALSVWESTRVPARIASHTKAIPTIWYWPVHWTR